MQIQPVAHNNPHIFFQVLHPGIDAKPVFSLESTHVPTSFQQIYEITPTWHIEWQAPAQMIQPVVQLVAWTVFKKHGLAAEEVTGSFPFYKAQFDLSSPEVSWAEVEESLPASATRVDSQNTAQSERTSGKRAMDDSEDTSRVVTKKAKRCQITVESAVSPTNAYEAVYGGHSMILTFERRDQDFLTNASIFINMENYRKQMNAFLSVNAPV